MSHDVCGDPRSHPPSLGSVKPAPWRRPAPPAAEPPRRPALAWARHRFVPDFIPDGSVNYFNRNSSPVIVLYKDREFALWITVKSNAVYDYMSLYR